ncbi:hypothetical protein BRADI_1g24132v3 [Brachypodium distachyon]|uniref:Uncharacterized protein n=1 Tax=Brachypodium distachyon TaxID=15368 RepID=A0A0Q3JCG6_BRADI|nr:hypothetical protein BRADI_1g24132v3 [Brachypodium distachyon]
MQSAATTMIPGLAAPTSTPSRKGEHKLLSLSGTSYHFAFDLTGSPAEGGWWPCCTVVTRTLFLGRTRPRSGLLTMHAEDAWKWHSSVQTSDTPRKHEMRWDLLLRQLWICRCRHLCAQTTEQRHCTTVHTRVMSALFAAAAQLHCTHSQLGLGCTHLWHEITGGGCRPIWVAAASPVSP